MLGMPNCKEVTRLVSDSMQRKLPLHKRVGLWMHLSMCKLCGGYKQELHVIQDAARRHADSIESDTSSGDNSLSSEARERLRRALESAESPGRDS